MRWRFWEPDHYSAMPGTIELPGRRLNLTEIDLIGRTMAQAVGASTYEFRSQWSDKPDFRLADLQQQLPHQLDCSITAGQPVQVGSPRPMTLHLQLSTRSPVELSGGAGGETVLSSIAATYEALGHRRKSRDWRYPVGFLLAIAVAVGPLIYAWIRGDLTLWAIPFVTWAIVAAFGAGVPRVRQAVQNQRQRTGGIDIDLRPIEQVRLDDEQKRQRRQTALLFSTMAAVPAALIGAIIQGLLT